MMNQINQAVPRVCPKCNQIVSTSETNCATCGRKMMTVRRVKTLGWMSLFCGLFLSGLIGWLSVWMYQAITQSGTPGAATTFHGGPQMIAFMIVVFGTVMIFGLFAALSGLWQIIYGRRNKTLTLIINLLGIVFMGGGLLINFLKWG